MLLHQGVTDFQQHSFSGGTSELKLRAADPLPGCRGGILGGTWARAGSRSAERRKDFEEAISPVRKENVRFCGARLARELDWRGLARLPRSGPEHEARMAEQWVGALSTLSRSAGPAE